MTTKSTELQIIPAQLDTAIADTKIERSKAEQHAMAFAPSMKLYIEISDMIKSLNKTNPSDTDAKIARENRLKLVRVRTGAEEIKDIRKEGIRAEGDLIQALFNVVKNSCLVTETEFTEIEKHQERLEEVRKAELAAARIELLSVFGTDTTYLPLGIMTDEQFTRLLENETLAFNARKEQAEKAERDRLYTERLAEEARQAQIKKDAEDREAQRLENIRLQKENEEKEKQLTKERAEAKLAADKLAKENEAKLAEQQRLAKIEADKQVAELKKQKDAADKLAAELKAKEEAEDLAHQKEKERIEAEETECLAKAKAAQLAPDKEKINALYLAIKAIVIPEFKSTEAKQIGISVQAKINQLLTDIKGMSSALK